MAGIVLLAMLTGAPEDQKRPIHTTVLADESASVAAGQIEPVLSGLDTIVSELPSSSGISIATFGTSAAPSILTMNATIDTANDSLSRTLRRAMWDLQPASRNAILIASDGYWQPEAHDALAEARQAGLPVFWLPLEPVEPAPAIRDIVAPARARPGQQISIAVETLPGGAEETEIVLFAGQHPVARSGASPGGTTVLSVTAPGQGPLILGAELRTRPGGALLDQYRAAALVNITTVPNILLVSPGPSAIGQSLRAGGWPLRAVTPQQFSTQADRLQSFASVILDDVAISDIPEAAWKKLATAVRNQALGLLVLGGPNSFGRGGYRNSQLETVLPLVSEPPGDEALADILFLIDVSGSMQGANEKADRLRIAKSSVLAASDVLRPTDRVGLITFDVGVRTVLPLKGRADHRATINKVWPGRASGGTSIMPAFERATAILNQDLQPSNPKDARQKILMLVTDGFFTSGDLTRLDTTLEGSDIELVVLLINKTESSDISGLARIVATHGGTVMQVNEILDLPALMKNELQSRRPALIQESVRPVSSSPAAWFPENAEWPAIHGYLLTRPKADAQVYLVSPRGDALIAGISAGAGKVIAITNGLSGWSRQWLNWEQWPDLVAALINHISVQDSGGIRISTRAEPGGMVAIAVETSAERPEARDLKASLIAPAGTLIRLDLKPEAAHRYRATAPVDGFGQFTVIVEDGPVTARQRFLHQPVNEPAPQGRPLAEQWLGDGLVRLWAPDSLQTLAQAGHWREWLIALALLGFLLVLVLERLPAGALQLRARRTKTRQAV